MRSSLGKVTLGHIAFNYRLVITYICYCYRFICFRQKRRNPLNVILAAISFITASVLFLSSIYAVHFKLSSTENCRGLLAKWSYEWVFDLKTLQSFFDHIHIIVTIYINNFLYYYGNFRKFFFLRISKRIIFDFKYS